MNPKQIGKIRRVVKAGNGRIKVAAVHNPDPHPPRL